MRLILVMLLVLSGFAHAGYGSINASINNEDLRNACYVETGNGSCASIRDDDQRYLCYAKTGNGSCGSIKNDDLRRQCEMVKR